MIASAAAAWPPSPDALVELAELAGELLLRFDARGRLRWASPAALAALGGGGEDSQAAPTGLDDLTVDPAAVAEADGGDRLGTPVAGPDGPAAAPGRLRSVADLQRLAPGATAGPLVLPVRRADRTVAWWEWSVRRHDAGDLLAVARDVTAARRRERRQQIRRRVLLELVEQAAAAIAVRDVAGRRCLANRQYEEWFASSLDHRGLDADEAEVVRSGISVAGELEVEVDGDLLTLLTVRFPLRDGTGRVTHVATVATDVTARLRAERAAQAGARLVEVLFRVSPDVVVVLDAAGHPVEMSGVFSELIGVDGPLSAADAGRFVHPDDLDAVRRWTSRLLRGVPDGKGRLGHRLVGPDGRVVHMQLSGRRLLGADGATVGAVVIGRDVTTVTEAAERRVARQARLEQTRVAKETFLAHLHADLAGPLEALAAAVHRLADVVEPASPQRAAVDAIVEAERQLRSLDGLAGSTPPAPGGPEAASDVAGASVGAGAAAAPGPAGSSPPGAPPAASGATIRVLHVEDDAASGELVRRLLQRRSDVELEHVADAASAVAAVRRRRPDVVLLDLGLPDVGGDALLAQLRADPGTADVPVVVVSADATAGQVERLRAAGAAEYLTKPVRLSSLMAVIDSYRRRP